MNPDGFTLAGQRKRCSILRCKMVCRFAVPSAFVFAVRAARDALPERHGLSPRPFGSPGEATHLSTVFYARKPDAV
ncbi:hypothetical protein C1O30_07100 [Dickeya zeae]|nr:hypothetical protein C1O30_07100 [Dickeya zeae]